MTHEEWRELVPMLRRAANLFSLPAHPETWPEWMTPDKRATMVHDFIAVADEIDRRYP